MSDEQEALNDLFNTTHYPGQPLAEDDVMSRTSDTPDDEEDQDIDPDFTPPDAAERAEIEDAHELLRELLQAKREDRETKVWNDQGRDEHGRWTVEEEDWDKRIDAVNEQLAELGRRGVGVGPLAKKVRALLPSLTAFPNKPEDRKVALSKLGEAEALLKQG